jgi:gliding motility-associated-like protein
MKETRIKLLRKQLLPVFLLLTGMAFSQDQNCEYIPPLETVHWMFGRNIGLVFNDSYSPEVYSGSAMSTPTGSAVMSDSNGNLLFYTNGEHVWDRRHQRMPNGQNLSDYLYNPTQAALIVPRPGASTQYYLFLTDEPDRPGGTRGFRYCLVDMSLNNGYGDVVDATKNVVLLPQSAEKLTAVQHANGQDYWVITHGWDNNRFHVYHITNQLPVQGDDRTFNLGAVHTSGGDPNVWNAKGYMKVSPRGDKIASVIHEAGLVEVFDFNNQTGEVSNARFLPSTYYRAYGLEFSPDSRFLYFSTLMTTVDAEDSHIYQVDLQSLNVEIIATPSTPSSSTFAGMQLGIDSKIYVIRFNRGGQNFNTSLGVIENPKRPGVACNFVETIPGFSNQFLQNGLPNFIQSYFDIPHIVHYPHCDGDLVELRLWNGSNTAATTWDFGDGPTPSSGSSVTHTFPGSGDYDVSVTEVFGGQNFGPFSETINIRALPTLMPDHPDNVLFLFPGAAYPMDGGGPFYEYRWYYSASDTVNWTFLEGGIGEQYREHTILNEGYYKLEVEDLDCCFNYRIIQVISLDVEIPTAFIPNGSPPNNIFKVFGGSVQNFNMYVYNRWGQMVFSEELSLGIGNGWDGRFNGKDSPMGIYAYVLLFDVEHEGDLKTITRRGTVMLLR